MTDQNNAIMASVLGAAFLGSILYADKVLDNKEHFGDAGTMSPTQVPSGYQGNNYVAPQGAKIGAPHYPQYPATKQFYSNKQRPAQAPSAAMAHYMGQQQVNSVKSNSPYAGPNGALPQGQANINLNTSGDQLLSYQLYQQAVNASTPTQQQLNSISGNSQQQTGLGADQLMGGLSADYAPYNNLGNSGPMLYDSEYQAVNFGAGRAESISACAQNAPTFVATSLLPKPTMPGQQSWEVGAPQDVLANQNFLSAVQQIGTDTVLSSHRNASLDLRGDIVNPINVVSPWNNTSITPSQEQRPLSCFIDPGQGIYGCGGPMVGSNQNPTFVGR